MGHHHHHHEVSGTKLFLTVVLNVIITLFQIIGGVISGSLALLSDAMHNFSDVLALLIAWGANRLSLKPSEEGKTFGFKRAEIIAALFNSSLLLAIAIFLIFEAVHKFLHPEPIESNWVIWLGVLSIVLNSASVLLIKDDSHDNMNVKAAYLHLMTDVATSIAVVVGGLLMKFWHIYWVDSVITILIAIYLIFASYDIIKESVAILMQFAPQINLEELAKSVAQIKEVKNIHHIHIWRLNDHDIFLEAHIDFSNNLKLETVTKKLEQIEQMLKSKFHISHVTLQPEYNRDDKKDLVV